MCVVLVGGHDRMHNEYKKTCEELGHKIKICTQMKARFSKTIGCPDVVVIFTNTVSHKMVKIASSEAKRKKIPVVRCHTSSKNALENKLINFEKQKNIKLSEKVV